MSPIRSYSNWNRRPSDHQVSIEPYRKYFFICEGANTETWYFQKLIDLRKTLGIHPLIDIRLLEKTGEDRDISYPAKLLVFAEAQKNLPEQNFDPAFDKMMVIFDADIFQSKVSGYQELLDSVAENTILGVTNPSFELFLLLHIANSYETLIKPNELAILKNEKSGNQRFIYSLLLSQTGINSKKNREIGELAKNVRTAIVQECYINQDIRCCLGQITCNIGQIIQTIMNDRANL